MNQPHRSPHALAVGSFTMSREKHRCPCCCERDTEEELCEVCSKIKSVLVKTMKSMLKGEEKLKRKRRKD